MRKRLSSHTTVFPLRFRCRYLSLGAEMLQAAGYSDAVRLMQMAYDVEYRIASFDNSEEASACVCDRACCGALM